MVRVVLTNQKLIHIHMFAYQQWGGVIFVTIPTLNNAA